jgi:uncharacterized damage-inducible protein DinB
MTIAELLDSFEYNRWAHGRILDAATELGAEAYDAAAPATFPTLRATLEHLLATEVVWLARWQGHSLGDLPDYSGCRDAAGLHSIWESFWRRQFRFLNDLSDEDLGQQIMIRTKTGIETVQSLRDTAVHVVHQSTFHRGQAAGQIRHLGGNPPATDYFIYCLSRDAGEPETAVEE